MTRAPGVNAPAMAKAAHDGDDSPAEADLRRVRYSTADLPERIAAKILAEDTSGCWLWTAGTNHGYGYVWHSGRNWRVHRLTYTLLIGEPPAGLDLDHLCRVRNCVNPAHLEPVTRRENMLRSPLVPPIDHCGRCDTDLDESNGYRRASGRFACKACNRASALAYYHSVGKYRPRKRDRRRNP